MDDTYKVFRAYDINACLYDERRVDFLRHAIFETVRKGDVVVDGGSGAGLLGMFAAQAGASKVYCIEINGEYVDVIRENALRNAMDNVIVAIHGDATCFELEQPVDVITSEVISAGFFYEPQLQILANLKRFLRPGGSIIPIAMENSIELIHAQDELYGLKLSYDARHKTLKGDVALTDRVSYRRTKFLDDTASRIDARVPVQASATGFANAARVSYAIEFTPGEWTTEATEMLLNPQIMFLPKPVHLEKGVRYQVSLGYESSSSPLRCGIDVIRDLGE